MESRLIFISSKAYKPKVEWENTKHPDSEWLSIESDKLKADETIKFIIDNFFDTDILHVSIGRKNSFTTNKNLVLNQLADFINQFNFHVWNENFTRTIEFNKIGVLRRGKT